MPSLNEVTPSNTSSGGKKFFHILAVALLLIASFGIGYQAGEREGTQEALGSGNVIGQGSDAPTHLSEDVNFDLFWDVWELLREEYVGRPVPETQLFYGALEGLVASVQDPYTAFLDPETTDAFTSELAGSFEGIGAEIGIRSEQLVIIAPLTGAPAEAAGISAGDAILAIDGVDTIGMPLDVAVLRIRGEQGSTVTLTLLSPGNLEAREVSVVRDVITIESVSHELLPMSNQESGQISYIAVSHFNEDTIEKFNDAVLETLAVENLGGVVLDLRNNPGGFLDGAIGMASYWVADGPVVRERMNDGQERLHEPTRQPVFGEDVDTIVLVNGGSASASEIVAGALQDKGRALIVGQQTFGKGSVQEFIPLVDGSAVKISVAEWLTPEGRSIEEEGIVPDIIVELPEDIAVGDDPMLQRALELLQ